MNIEAAERLMSELQNVTNEYPPENQFNAAKHLFY